MFETLFGAEMPLAMRFFIAFVIVLALIGAFFWVMRRFGAERLGAAGSRSRQPRLAVIDAAAVDSRRRLVLIRRDNVEHLLMIGGPSDVVVEANIVRAAATQREMPVPRSAAATDTLPRPVPLAEGTMWPLQPEPVAAPAPARASRAVEEMQWSAEAEPAPAPAEAPLRRSDAVARLQRSQDSAIIGFPAEPITRPVSSPDIVAARPAPMIERAPGAERISAAERHPAAGRPTPAERVSAAERAAERIPTAERTPTGERTSTAERAPAIERTPAIERATPASERVPPAVERAPAAERATIAAPPLATEPLAPAADQNLTEMAQRLEAALRRPIPAEPQPDNRPRPASEPSPTAPVVTEAVVATASAESRAKPKNLYDSLEQEMASLLGRPAGKP